MRISAITLLAILACCSQARAEGFASLGQHSRLANHAIVEVGDVEKLEPPPGTKWSNEILRINNRWLDRDNLALLNVEMLDYEIQRCLAECSEEAKRGLLAFVSSKL